MNHIAEKVRKLRESFQLTPVEFGKRIGMPSTHLIKIEKGEVIPDVDSLKFMSIVLNIDISYFDDEPNSNQKIELVDRQCLYDLTVDGKPITNFEREYIVRQIRLLREMKVGRLHE
ncbi:helix-turn-helix transcriptional regulator (plasmid) [Alkalihalophilus pseudofirmus]|uniref:helix-turn-helix domain-containing protein n=1 Tax=Alkalihalophilus pseudofirmus TaxID=79885 RepID=UPI00259BD279|nr:helix-turn-helix transcriptional regulator [Alkalihalophilus pseudofirmus]WEG19210.1 helix-turn-helix transcriptional regulator [Alkalihalophilus pseudofirmus]